MTYAGKQKLVYSIKELDMYIYCTPEHVHSNHGGLLVTDGMAKLQIITKNSYRVVVAEASKSHEDVYNVITSRYVQIFVIQ